MNEEDKLAAFWFFTGALGMFGILLFIAWWAN